MNLSPTFDRRTPTPQGLPKEPSYYVQISMRDKDKQTVIDDSRYLIDNNFEMLVSDAMQQSIKMISPPVNEGEVPYIGTTTPLTMCIDFSDPQVEGEANTIIKLLSAPNEVELYFLNRSQPCAHTYPLRRRDPRK